MQLCQAHEQKQQETDQSCKDDVGELEAGVGQVFEVDREQEADGEATIVQESQQLADEKQEVSEQENEVLDEEVGMDDQISDIEVDEECKIQGEVGREVDTVDVVAGNEDELSNEGNSIGCENELTNEANATRCGGELNQNVETGENEDGSDYEMDVQGNNHILDYSEETEIKPEVDTIDNEKILGTEAPGITEQHVVENEVMVEVDQQSSTESGKGSHESEQNHFNTGDLRSDNTHRIEIRRQEEMPTSSASTGPDGVGSAGMTQLVSEVSCSATTIEFGNLWNGVEDQDKSDGGTSTASWSNLENLEGQLALECTVRGSKAELVPELEVLGKSPSDQSAFKKRRLDADKLSSIKVATKTQPEDFPQTTPLMQSVTQLDLHASVISPTSKTLSSGCAAISPRNSRSIPKLKRTRPNPKTPPSKALKFFGVDAEEVQRSKALKKLGLTEQDLYDSLPFFKSREQQNRIRAAFESRYSAKLLRITGMDEEQILRRKALRCLGITEEELETEREKRLAELGEQKRTRAKGDPFSEMFHGLLKYSEYKLFEKSEDGCVAQVTEKLRHTFGLRFNAQSPGHR